MIFLNDPIEIPDPAIKAGGWPCRGRRACREVDAIGQQRGYSLAMSVGIAQGVAPSAPSVSRAGATSAIGKSPTSRPRLARRRAGARSSCRASSHATSKRLCRSRPSASCP